MTNNLSIVKQILYSMFFVFSSLYLIKGEVLVTARCGRPGLPPEAKFYRKSPERFRFDNNEKVIVLCKDSGFPHHLQTRTCKNGRWTGKKARCGKLVDAQVIKFEIEDCESPSNNLLLSQPINQTTKTDDSLPPDSFHSSRVSEDTILSSNGSTCYLWKIKFDKTVQITFLIVDIYMPITNTTREVPNLVPIVSKYRKCELQHHRQQLVENTIGVIRYYYFCDFKSNEDWRKELSELSDTISARINISIAREIGLDAVVIGDIYKTTFGTRQVVKPDCGDLEGENTGADVQREFDHAKITCNDSFSDHSQNPAESNKFTCNSNGEWVGKWPVCVPIVSCSKNEIIRDKDSSVVIREIGNVYYFNSSQWFAINGSWIRYTCQRDNDIIFGNSFRTCMENGRWSDKGPYCTTTGLSGFKIAGILFVVLIIFALVVFLVFRLYSSRVKREFTQTLNKFEENTIKRFSEDYEDVEHCNFYENDNDFPRKSIMYDGVCYEEVRPNRPSGTEAEYLDMIDIREVKKPS